MIVTNGMPLRVVSEQSEANIRKQRVHDQLTRDLRRFAANFPDTRNIQARLNGGCWTDEPSRPVTSKINPDGSSVPQPARSTQAPAYGPQMTAALAWCLHRPGLVRVRPDVREPALLGAMILFYSPVASLFGEAASGG
jgi:hypothetical protein